MNAPPVAIDFENDAFAEGIPHEMFRWLRDNEPVRWYDWPQGKGSYRVLVKGNPGMRCEY